MQQKGEAWKVLHHLYITYKEINSLYTQHKTTLTLIPTLICTPHSKTQYVSETANSFRVIQPTVHWHTFKTFMFVFTSSSSSQKLFVKYLINTDLIWLSVTRYKPKLSHGLTCHFILDRLHWCAKQWNRTSMLPGESILYLSTLWPFVMSYWYLHWILWCINQVTVNAVYYDFKLEPFFYLQSEHIPSKWENTRSDMQVLTELKKSHCNHTMTKLWIQFISAACFNLTFRILKILK